MERSRACQLEVAIYSEVVAETAVADLLPINALRNAASLPARTPLVLLLDVDMLISSNLLPALASHTKGYDRMIRPLVL